MAKKAAKTATEVAIVPDKEISFTKSKLLGFSKYRKRRDLLSALLKDGESYTKEQADALLNKFLGDDM